jgi:hypothetical protein
MHHYIEDKKILPECLWQRLDPDPNSGRFLNLHQQCGSETGFADPDSHGSETFSEAVSGFGTASE